MACVSFSVTEVSPLLFCYVTLLFVHFVFLRDRLKYMLNSSLMNRRFHLSMWARPFVFSLFVVGFISRVDGEGFFLSVLVFTALPRPFILLEGTLPHAYIKYFSVYQVCEVFFNILATFRLNFFHPSIPSTKMFSTQMRGILSFGACSISLFF